MDFYQRDVFFTASLQSLFSTTNKKEFAAKVKQLEDFVIRQNNPSLIYRLAYELDSNDYKITRLENAIVKTIDHRSSYYILRFARELKGANIKKLQNALINNGNIVQVARFGCIIPGADKDFIEHFIVQSNNAKAAYYFLRYAGRSNTNRLKPIILKSKRPRYLYALAFLTHDKEEFNQIQDLIINSNSFMYMRLLAKHMKNADVDRIVNRIIASGNVVEMKRLHNMIKSDRLEKLSALF